MTKNQHIVLAGFIGNALEWFDFLLYAYFSSLLATLFFPVKDHFISMILSLSALALGFLVRPLGAFFMGYCGDRFGRKRVLLMTILMMTFPTCCMGLLPTYAQIGMAAPLLLLLLRILQGLAVSGELNNTASFLIEHAEVHRHGLVGSLAMCSAVIGILLGAMFTTSLYAFLTPEALFRWGWRVAFLSASVLGVFGFWIRSTVPESPQFLKAKIAAPELVKARIVAPLFLEHKGALVLAFTLTLAMAVQNYFLFSYFTVFLQETFHFLAQKAMIINVFALLFLAIMIPCMGWLSDQIGRRKVFMSGLMGMIILVYPIFLLLMHRTFASVLSAELLFALLTAPIAALIPTMLVELFPIHVRNTGSSLGYNCSLAVFGGTTPLVAMLLQKWVGSSFAPAYYVMLTSIISLTAAWFFWKVKPSVVLSNTL